MEDFVPFAPIDFEPVEFIDQETPKENLKAPTIEYDHYTKEKYRVMRKRIMDPITYVDLNERYSFKFPYKWDPYTGERLEKDEDGPLYFDPDILIKYFHTKRLDKLWVKPSDEQGGYFSGYYDDGLGAGEEFFVAGRGEHPEWYLFRIPIIDCYLTKDHNKQVITFGPKLTDEEVDEIDRIAQLRPDNYKSMYGCNRPSLKKMKELYDNAISKTPNISSAVQIINLKQAYFEANKQAVDSLIKMKG
jgi:hypothetical protein